MEKSIGEFYRFFLDELSLAGAEGFLLTKIEETVSRFFELKEHLEIAMNYIWTLVRPCQHLEFYFCNKPSKLYRLNDLDRDYIQIKRDSTNNPFRIVMTEKHRERVIKGSDLICYRLNPKSIQVLDSISKAKEHGITQSLLSKTLKIDPRSLFSYLKRLEQLRIIFKVYIKGAQSHTSNCRLTRYLNFEPEPGEFERVELDEKARGAIDDVKHQIICHLEKLANRIAFRDDIFSCLDHVSRQWICMAINELVKENQVERVLCQLDIGLKPCIAMVDNPSEAETQGLIMDNPKLQNHRLKYLMPIKYQILEIVRAVQNEGITMSEILELLPVPRKYMDSLLGDLCDRMLVRIPEFFGKERRFRYYCKDYGGGSLLKETGSRNGREDDRAKAAEIGKAARALMAASNKVDNSKARSITRELRERIILEMLDEERYIRLDKSVCSRLLERQTKLINTSNSVANGMETTRLSQIPFAPDIKTVLRIVNGLQERGLLRVLVLETDNKWGGKAVTRRIILHPSVRDDDTELQKFVRLTSEAGVAEISKPRIFENVVVERIGQKSPKKKVAPEKEDQHFPSRKYGFIRSRMNRLVIFHKFLLGRLAFSDEDPREIPLSKEFFDEISLFEYLQIFGVSANSQVLDKELVNNPGLLSQSIGRLPERARKEVRHSKNASWNYKKKILFYLQDLLALGLVRAEGQDVSFKHIYLNLTVANPLTGDKMRFEGMETVTLFWCLLEVCNSKSGDFHAKVVDTLIAAPLPLANVIHYKKVWTLEPQLSFYLTQYMINECLAWRKEKEYADTERLFFGDFGLFLHIADKFDQSFSRLQCFWKNHSSMIREKKELGPIYKPEFVSKYNIESREHDEIFLKDVVFLLGYMIVGHVYANSRVEGFLLIHLKDGLSTILDQEYLEQFDCIETIQRYFNQHVVKELGFWICESFYEQVCGGASSYQGVEKRLREFGVVENGIELINSMCRTLEQEFAFIQTETDFRPGDKGSGDHRNGEKSTRMVLMEKLAQKQSIGSSLRRRSLIYTQTIHDLYSPQWTDFETVCSHQEGLQLYQLAKMILLPANELDPVVAHQYLEQYSLEQVDKALEELKEHGIISKIKNPMKSQSANLLPGRFVVLSDRYMEYITANKEIDSKYRPYRSTRLDVLGPNTIMDEKQLEQVITQMVQGTIEMKFEFEGDNRPGVFLDCKLTVKERVGIRSENVQPSRTGFQRSNSVEAFLAQTTEPVVIWDLQKHFKGIQSQELWEILEFLCSKGTILKLDQWTHVHSNWSRAWFVPQYLQKGQGWVVGAWVEPYIWTNLSNGAQLVEIKRGCMETLGEFVSNYPGISMFGLSVRFRHIFTFREQSRLLESLLDENRIFQEKVCVETGKIVEPTSISKSIMTCFYPRVGL